MAPKNRGDRRQRKALIKRALLARTNRWLIGLWIDRFGNAIGGTVHDEERVAYHRHRAIVNEGRPRIRMFGCGEPECNYCLDSRLHKHRRASAARDADWQAWLAGDHWPTEGETDEPAE